MSDQPVTPEQIDAPGPLAELTAAFEAYERALMANDVAALDAMFWQSPLTLRYGVGENLYGIEEIARFRRERPGGSPPRTLRRTRITTFGACFGTANTEFERVGGGRHGRQSQTWIRLAEGWRIAAAHVSLIADAP